LEIINNRKDYMMEIILGLGRERLEASKIFLEKHE
jgi:hypothetical protein